MNKDKTYDVWQKILDSTRLKRRRIGIGLKTITPRIIESLKKASEYVDIVIVGEENSQFESVKSLDLVPLIQMAKDGRLDAIVRGNFDALEAYNSIKEVLGHTEGILEINLFKLNGVNMIDENARGIFCVLPVSFINDRTFEDKIKSIDLHLDFFKKIGISPKLGILAPGKPIDIVENVPEVSAGLKEA